ncbi:MAG TPA: KH domain-containing protein [Candidatus Paceibacterota bacterium]
MEKDQELLEYVIKAIVDHPEAVKIARIIDERGVLLTLDIHAEDMGKVIGKMGNTAKAIRTILRVVGIKNGARVNLKINEPEGSTRPVRAANDEGVTSAEPGYVHKSEAKQAPALKTVDEAMADLNLG